MLTSKKLELRRSEIRQSLAELANIEKPSDDETRKMGELDAEYRTKETQYRAALIAEDNERREAGEEIETRSDREWSEMITGFEVRQVALALDQGEQLHGQTAEIVSELREKGGYRGMPIPWEALEVRAGETIASGTPDPIRTAPIIDRLFPQSVAAQMGGSMVNVGVGDLEYPVTTSSVTAGWAATETGDVAGPAAFAVTDKALAPNQTMGVQMVITRKALKQSGAALEQAVRRDMNSAIQQEMDRATFLGSGAAGEPLGLIPGIATYGITDTAISAAPTWAAFRAAVVRFINSNAANGPGAVRLLLRPEVWDTMDGDIFDAGSGITEWDRLTDAMQSVTMTNNALADPAGAPLATNALMTTSAGGVAPFFVGTWGAIDLIRDPYTKAASGQLTLTALTTMDITVARGAQIELLTDVQ